DHNGLKIYTHLQSTNGRYHLFANYLLQNHFFVESGGVRPSHSGSTDSLFNLPTQDVNLRSATGRDKRHSFHIGQTFSIYKERLKVFYDFDQRRQFDRFDDNNLQTQVHTTGGQVQTTLFFYPNKVPNLTNYDTAQTHDRTTYTEVQ